MRNMMEFSYDVHFLHIFEIISGTIFPIEKLFIYTYQNAYSLPTVE